MADASEPPPSFVCPLTHGVMRDPVVDPEGNSYERSAIEEWLSRSGTSPVTRSLLRAGDLVPNRALCELIAASPFSPNGGKSSTPPTTTGATATAASSADVAATHIDVSVSIQSACASDLSGVSPCAAQLGEGETEVVAVLSLSAAGRGSRTPLDVCCVVDISGSMGTEAVLQNAEGDTESHGLSLLDIVKHAVRTVAKVLGESDRLSLVVFDTVARRVFGLTRMDSAGVLMMERELAKLQPEDTTNLWDGLRVGMETLGENADPSRMSAILLLTDGMPNVVPPRGHIPMLRRYAEQHDHKLPVISCFGFGYTLDSPLLRDLSTEGLGAFSFIPDSGMVGTAFVHALAQLLSTAARSLSFKINLTKGVRLLNHPGRASSADKPSTDDTLFPLGTLQFGQSRDIVLRFAVPPEALASSEELGYASISWAAPAPSASPETTLVAIKNCLSGTLPGRELGFVDSHSLRSAFVDSLLSAVDTVIASHKGPAMGSYGFSRGNTDDPDSLLAGLVSARACLKPVEIALAAHVSKAYAVPAMADLLKDIRGQVAEALSRADWFLRWGVHYLPSLAEAHALQQANNFKDASVQSYGGTLFAEVRDVADDVFCSLPPPKPSRRTSQSTGRSSSSSPSSVPPAVDFDMFSYHNSGAPCFDGRCVVQMADGSEKQVRNLQRGDMVLAPECVGGGVSVVRCVVRTMSSNGQQSLIELDGGLLVTPFHPVFVGGAWMFPIDALRLQKTGTADGAALSSDNRTLIRSMTRTCPEVYSFVLDPMPGSANASSADALIINKVPCVSLGHSIVGDGVASHPFWGSRVAVNSALNTLPGYEAGFITLSQGCTVRSPTSGLVCGLVQRCET